MSGLISAPTAALRLLRSEGYRSTATSTLARDPSSAQCAGKASATAGRLPNTWLSTQKRGLTCAPIVAELLRLKTTCISIKRKCIPANTCEHTLQLKHTLLSEPCNSQFITRYNVQFIMPVMFKTSFCTDTDRGNESLDSNMLPVHISTSTGHINGLLIRKGKCVFLCVYIAIFKKKKQIWEKCQTL